jgi:hypothetical protein
MNKPHIRLKPRCRACDDKDREIDRLNQLVARFIHEAATLEVRVRELQAAKDALEPERKRREGIWPYRRPWPNPVWRDPYYLDLNPIT